MGYLISRWLLEHNIFNNYKVESPSNWLKNLSKVNIFIGQNNTGKSRFLRKLFFDSNTCFLPSDIGKLINDMYSELSNYDPIKSNNLRNLEDDIVFRVNEKYKDHYSLNFDRLVQGLTNNLSPNSINVIKTKNQKYLNAYPDILWVDKIYIPVLRGLRPFDSQAQFYNSRTQNDYFPEYETMFLKKKLGIYTGLEFYRKWLEIFTGSDEKQELKNKYINFLNDCFFKEGIEILPRSSDDYVYVNVAGEGQYPIFNLGDGLQQLIIMTFPLFEFSKNNSKLLLFIEEPELYLHPGLQRKFLEIILNNKYGDFQVFLTTHSNHFIDMSLDFENISIYKFTKEYEKTGQGSAVFNIENTSNEDRNLLECLGVKNSSVMLSNCTIWVEGITDRMYIRHYFKLFQEEKIKAEDNFKAFEEDKHYSFVEYSGNNITHWSFLDEENGINQEKLCGKLFLIADRDDIKSKAKSERHKKLLKVLGEHNYHRLNCREIENLLSKNTFEKILKSINDSKQLAKFNYSDYKTKKLGQFIEDVVYEGSPPQKYASSTGSLSSRMKSKFAEIAKSEISQFDDLSLEAQKLCEKIYKFIENNNS